MDCEQGEAGAKGSAVSSVKSTLQGKVIQSQAREIVANVFAFMKREAEFGQQIPVRCVTKRVIAATGVSERSIRRIQREAELVYSGEAASFVSPRARPARPQKRLLQGKRSLIQDRRDSSSKALLELANEGNIKIKLTKCKKDGNKMLYPSLEDMKVDQLARAQRPYGGTEPFLHQQQTSGLSSNPLPLPYPLTGPANMYPSIGQPGQAQSIIASAPPPYSLTPSAPSSALTPIQSHSGTVARHCHSTIYPSLDDYMGLELSPETIARNMPEYQTPAILASMELQPVVSPAGGMVAPLSGQSLGLQRAQVTHGIRELTVCKGADGKVGLRVQTVNNGVFVCVVVKGSPAALAGLRFGDQILQVNGIIVAGYTMDQVHKLFKESPINGISVVVRDRPFERTVTLHKDSTGHVGFHFKDGKIVGLVQDSSAARNGLLTDHHVLEVNGQNVVGVPDKDITALINEGGPTITITIIPSFVFDHMVKKMSSNLLKTAMDHSIPNV